MVELKKRERERKRLRKKLILRDLVEEEDTAQKDGKAQTGDYDVKKRDHLKNYSKIAEK